MKKKKPARLEQDKVADVTGNSNFSKVAISTKGINALADERFVSLMTSILVDHALEETRRSEKLKEFPRGYPFDKKGYSCVICGYPASGENSWYDRHGLKCMCCQKAVNDKIIPVAITKNRDSYYTSAQLKICFNLTPRVINRWIKDGVIKDRVIPGKDGKGKHLQLFLLKDNKGFFPPPKKLRVGGPVKETLPGGREEYVFYPWYCFVDPIKHLSRYGISQYMRAVPLEKNGAAEPELNQ